jgi:hypothetical protein
MGHYLFLGGPADGIRMQIPEPMVQLHEPWRVYCQPPVSTCFEPDVVFTSISTIEYYPHRLWCEGQQVTVYAPSRDARPNELLAQLVRGYAGNDKRKDYEYELGRTAERQSLIEWFGHWMPTGVKRFIEFSLGEAFKRRGLR